MCCSCLFFPRFVLIIFRISVYSHIPKKGLTEHIFSQLRFPFLLGCHKGIATGGGGVAGKLKPSPWTVLLQRPDLGGGEIQPRDVQVSCGAWGGGVAGPPVDQNFGGGVCTQPHAREKREPQHSLSERWPFGGLRELVPSPHPPPSPGLFEKPRVHLFKRF